MLTAAAADQNALDDYKVNGLFTYLLLDALGEWRHQQRWPDRAERACRTHPDAGAEVDRQVNGARTRQQAVSGRLLDALKSSSVTPARSQRCGRVARTSRSSTACWRFRPRPSDRMRALACLSYCDAATPNGEMTAFGTLRRIEPVLSRPAYWGEADSHAAAR